MEFALVIAVAALAVALYLKPLPEIPGPSPLMEHRHELPPLVVSLLHSLLEKQEQIISEAAPKTFPLVPGDEGQTGGVRIRPGQVLSYAGVPGQPVCAVSLYSGQQFYLGVPVEELEAFLKGEDDGEQVVADPGQREPAREEATGGGSADSR